MTVKEMYQIVLDLVGLDFMPEDSGIVYDNEKEVKKGLKSASGWLRRELGSALKLVYTPELVFEVDHSIEYGAKISGILDNLNIPELPEEEAEDWE